jgi:hypothetical protein
MTSSFWAGGHAAFETGIRQHYEAAINDLRNRLATMAARFNSVAFV